MSAEQWRPVVGYPHYEVSDHGRVRSTFDGRTRVLKPTPTNGYLNFKAYNGSRQSRATVFVHRAVMEAFVGPRPDGMLIRHLDGNQRNNARSNLAYGTPLENNLDTLRHGTHRTAGVTVCIRGHAYDEENTYTRPNGLRCCRACGREQSRRARLRRAVA